MSRTRSLFHLLLLTCAILALGITQGIRAQTQPSGAGNERTARTRMMRQTTNADRQAAARRRAAARGTTLKGRAAAVSGLTVMSAPASAASLYPSGLRPGGVPDYFNVANYANSPLPVLDASGNVVPGTGMRKFVDSLPGLGAANANNLGAFIPIAIPITGAPGIPADGDYYEIGLYDYTQQMHSDLPPTLLRGYRDLSPAADGKNHYLGPVIIAQRGRPVRLKFVNGLGTGNAGNLFIPVDKTLMGAGFGPDGPTGLMYTENRAVLHLHGGHAVWISDGTPHQWITPAGETGPAWRLTGASHQHVPDMPDPGPGAASYFWTNDQSGRLMFYHDHAYGITRLNVYAGEAAGYIIWDQPEEDLISGTNVSGINPATKKVLPDLGGVYHYGVPLIIQDKTFVPGTTPPAAGQKFSTTDASWGTDAGGQLGAQDPTWDTTKWGAAIGSLWFPHVYTPNQNPSDSGGSNAFGRWDYGPWFWPPLTATAGLVHGEVMGDGTNGCATGVRCLGIQNPSTTPEAFMDTPVVNGTPYPYMTVQRQAYRFRILNAANDRSFNFQLYYADPANPTEVKMVPAVPTANFPPNWPTDGREGGVPDPTTVGPPLIQIGTESGFLPAPVVIPSTPIGYEYDRRSITVLNVSTHALLLGPAERADVIVDFSAVPPGSTLLLYNDAPAPNPGFDARLDYFTGDSDHTDTGGAPTTIAGYGPNTRTVMQFRVAASGQVAAPFDLVSLQTAIKAAFEYDQPQPIVAETVNAGVATDTYARIQDTTVSANGVTYPLQPKAIQELFELNYGRMNATLGVELPLTNFNTQTTIPLGYVDPITEVVTNGAPQLWKITHNGVDTHFVHFHLSDVQVVNRIGWDGVVKPPDPNETGWKDTVRMNPLEDIVVAIRPTVPGNLPASWPKQANGSQLPDSMRPLDPTSPIGANLSVVDPATGNFVTVPNAITSFGWEYVWHCHILGHEENDMMRPVMFDATPTPPQPVIASVTPASGPAGGGTVLTIVGSNFPGTAQVWVGGVQATAVTVNAGGTQITATTPANTPGLVADVVVATPGNVIAPEMQGLTPTPNAGVVTSSLAFSYLATPTVTAVSPAAGPTAGGIPVTITGTNFVPGGTTVTFGGVAATAVAVSSPTSLSTILPANAAGVVDVVVANGIGSATLVAGFTYGGPPAVTAIAPAVGPNSGGSVVVITGNNFIAGATTVTIGGTAATGVTVNGAGMLTAITPPGAVGLADVVVTSAGGSATLARAFSYYAVVSSTGVNPTAGPVAGGTTVTITALGTTFVAGTTTVTIGGTAATSVNVTSATTLTCVTPPGTAGAAAIVITTPPGPSIMLAGIGFTYVNAPTVTAVAPITAPATGGTLLTLTGTGFVPGNTVVMVGGNAATLIDVTSATSLTAVAPAGSGAAPISVATTGGTGTFNGFSYYSNAPTITAVAPAKGPTGGGTTITITGTFFQAGGTTVTVGGAPATSIAYVSATTITAVTPKGAAGTAAVVVTTFAGTSPSSVPFTYLPPAVDLNGDGLADVFSYDASTGAFTVLAGDGTGNYTPSHGTVPAGFEMKLADFNGDGVTDIFAYNATTGAWQQMINDGTGKFTTYSGTWWAGWTVTVLDVNGDKKSDLFLYNRATGVWVLAVSTGPGAFTFTTSAWWPGWTVSRADFNGDGNDDLFLYDPTSGTYVEAITTTPGSFTYTSSTWWPGWQVTVLDLDGDKKSDLFLYNPTTGLWVECLNTGAGAFQYASATWWPGWNVTKADLNGDGKDEIFLYNPNTGVWVECVRVAAGAYSLTSSVWWSGWKIGAADMDGDGRTDLMLYDPISGMYVCALSAAGNSFKYLSGWWAPGRTLIVDR